MAKNSCLKFLIKVGAWLTTIFGVTIFGFGIFMIVKANSFHYDSLYYNSSNLLKFLQQYGFLIFGLVIFIFGLCGISGARNSKHSCRGFMLFLYQIAAILFTVVFGVLAIFTLYKAEKTFSGDCTASQWSKEINDAIESAQLIFGYSCPVKYDTSNFQTLPPFQSQDQGINKFQQCTEFDAIEYGPEASLMETAESLFMCSGWCNKQNFYMFSDINRGNPENDACFTEVGAFVTRWGKNLGYVLMGLTVFFGFNVICTMMLCCSSEEKAKSSNVYIRMQAY